MRPKAQELGECEPAASLHDQFCLESAGGLYRLQDRYDPLRLEPHPVQAGDQGLQITPFKHVESAAGRSTVIAVRGSTAVCP